MIRRPPRSTRTDTLFPYTTLFRSAKALIAGLILYGVVHEDRERRTLATVRDYLTLAPKDFADLPARMQDSHGAGGLIARAANSHLGKSDREADGGLSVANPTKTGRTGRKESEVSNSLFFGGGVLFKQQRKYK